ncbi:protein FAR1-RELATED SEQUENCE 5-like [Juglans regia]|uniref:Protein FAR1-RELATED SEQUENCE n=1 Tax=Juglans regia TaxID=51240 RepID=A0A6P9EXZ8_JUGRE|nr:protein FAR1-RELATED SEQUENCE 5-like [Juglans regia]
MPQFHSSVNPSIDLHFASPSNVEEILSTTPDSREVESLSTSTIPNTVESKDDDESRTQNIVHTEVSDNIEEPKLGMLFKSEEELFSYYKKYGKQCGFGVSTQSSKRFKDGTLRYITLGCARGGKARNRTSNVARPRPTSKTECKAKINATFVDGMLKVLSVHNEHNHGLSPQKSRFFRCNREVSESVKRVLDTNDQAGIRMNKSFASLVQGAGGYENLSFLEKDCRNYIDKARHIRVGKGGAGALREYFARMQYKHDAFFALMDLDDDGLISSEDTETFIWLFETWLNCMDGNAPKAIITDQDRAMKNAIATVFPNSRHRFCLWHILKKVPEKLGSHSAYKTRLKSQLLKCVYDSQTIEEFEKCWDMLLTTYNLQENA